MFRQEGDWIRRPLINALTHVHSFVRSNRLEKYWKMKFCRDFFRFDIDRSSKNGFISDDDISSVTLQCFQRVVAIPVDNCDLPFNVLFTSFCLTDRDLDCLGQLLCFFQIFRVEFPSQSSSTVAFAILCRPQVWGRGGIR